MNEEQKPEIVELLTKQIRWQKRTFFVQFIEMVMLSTMVCMWLFIFMYSS